MVIADQCSVLGYDQWAHLNRHVDGGCFMGKGQTNVPASWEA